jgi:hypothetical protein
MSAFDLPLAVLVVGARLRSGVLGWPERFHAAGVNRDDQRGARKLSDDS